MKILLRRFAFKSDYTIGRLSVDGASLCDTLEPCSRHAASYMQPSDIRRMKLKGVMAIPTGTYQISMRYSAKFNKFMPFLNDVKGFSGILIHPGNYPKDTRGCILPGWNRRKGMVCGSLSAMEKILSLIEKAIGRGESVSITIKEK